MKSITTTIALAAAATLITTAGAIADTKRGNVTNFVPGTLEVIGNSQDYTQLKTTGNTKMTAHVEYDTGTFGHVKSWSVIPSIKKGTNGVYIDNLQQYKVSKSYPVGHRPKIVDKYVEMTIPASALAGKAVAMCNENAGLLRAQGKSNKWIFDRDHEVLFKASVIFETDANGAGSNDPIYEASLAHDIKVVCKKWSGAAIPTAGDLANKVDVKKATMKLKSIALPNGACKVRLTTAISTNTANATIKYRYVHSSGKKSKTFSTKTAANNIAVVTQEWDIPNKEGREVGWMQMEGTNVAFNSNRARYRMQCKDGVGGFAANPKKPTVAVPLGGNGMLSN